MEGSIDGSLGILGVRERCRCGGRGVGIAEEHEDVPDAKLGGERDGVVEEGEVPAGTVCRC